MGCILLVQALINVLPRSLHWWLHYHVIRALHCISKMHFHGISIVNSSTICETQCWLMMHDTYFQVSLFVRIYLWWWHLQGRCHSRFVNFSSKSLLICTNTNTHPTALEMLSRPRSTHVHEANVVIYHCMCKRWLHQDCKHLHYNKIKLIWNLIDEFLCHTSNVHHLLKLWPHGCHKLYFSSVNLHQTSSHV